MATAQEDPYENVQFCPCGHVYRMRRSEIVAKGGQEQLDAIAAGEKLDAVIFHSDECGDCIQMGESGRYY